MAELSETEYLAPMQVAKLLNVRLDTVLRRFGKEPGVIDLTPKEKKKPGSRRRHLLRIPRGLLNRYLHENRVDEDWAIGGRTWRWTTQS